MTPLTWEQKLAALESVANASLRMRKPGDWYVSWRAESVAVGQRGFLASVYSGGRTPEEAVESLWAQVTGDGVEAVVVNAMGPERREYKWIGYMWRDVTLVGKP